MKLTFLLLALPVVLPAQPPNLSVIHKIKEEAFQNSKVMDNEFYLTDVYGPRLTNSPGYFAAANWAVKTLEGWGISAHLEEWGAPGTPDAFGQGWQMIKFSGHMVEPQYSALIGYPQAWTGGTNGILSGEATLAIVATAQDVEKWRGKLKGKIVLSAAASPQSMLTDPLGRRYTDEQLAELADAPVLGPVAPGGGGRGAARELQMQIQKFWAAEQPAILIRPGTGRSTGGTVFGGAAGSRNASDPVSPPTVNITPEQYNRMVRLIEHNIPVKVEFDVQTKFLPAQPSVDVVGEIPGNGPHKDQIVMVGAHLDSWHGGTGATDNAAGSAVMLEVMRVLKTLDLHMDRTVRIGLWGGEEEGLLGSRAYVKAHFADPQDMKLKPEQAKLDAYYNIDNGSGKVRGIYLQGNDMVRPIFEAWMQPFKDMGVSTISIRDTGGTDHLSYDAVGIPGFQFIQEPLEYDSRTHHSNMDVYDRVQRGDMMQIAAVVSAFVYNTSERPGMMPRKPLPAPRPNTAPGGGAGAPTGARQAPAARQ